MRAWSGGYERLRNPTRHIPIRRAGMRRLKHHIRLTTYQGAPSARDLVGTFETQSQDGPHQNIACGRLTDAKNRCDRLKLKSQILLQLKNHPLSRRQLLKSRVERRRLWKIGLAVSLLHKLNAGVCHNAIDPKIKSALKAIARQLPIGGYERASEELCCVPLRVGEVQRQGKHGAIIMRCKFGKRFPTAGSRLANQETLVPAVRAVAEA
jgi:hypothetical protein